MAAVDVWSEPLKSVTFVKLAAASSVDASHAQPFHLSCAPDLSALYCCASAEGQVIVFPDECPPQQVEMPVPPHVSFLERGAGSDAYVGISSSTQVGSSVRRVQLTMRSNTSSSIATGGEVVAGGKGRGFQDGPKDVALFHSPSLCAVRVCTQSPRRIVLAVADRGNFAIRLIDATPGERYGCVRTVCGCGVPGYNDGPHGESMLREVTGMQWTAEGHLVFSDGANHAIRLLRRRQEGAPGDDVFADTFDTLTLLGGHSKREGHIDGPLAQALCHRPCGLSAGPTQQYLLFADSGNNAIRLIDLMENTVSTIASTADYEPGSPVPQGLVDVSQVFTVALKDGIGAQRTPQTPPVSVVCASQSQRAVSMIVATTLPLPSRKLGQGVVSIGSLYHLVNDSPVCSNVVARLVQLTQRPPQRKGTVSMALGNRPKGAYADLELSRRRRDEEAQHRSGRPATASAAQKRSPSQKGSSASTERSFKDPTSTGGQSILCDVPDDDAHRNLRVVFEAHASWLHPRDAHGSGDASGVQPADMHLSMKRLHYWNFCVMAELTVVAQPTQNGPCGAPCYDVLEELYAHSCKRSGYKTVARMPFQAFADAVLQLYHHTHPKRTASAGQGRNSSGPTAVKPDSKVLHEVVQTYCANAQSPRWRARQMLLDLMTANEVPLLRIFHAYTNDINRKQHVGRLPYLRFQSLFHTLHIYPSLITQHRLKVLFAESLQCSLFFDPAGSGGAEGSADDAGSSSAMTKAEADMICKEKSMNLFQFLEGILRVAWSCFSGKGKQLQSPKSLARMLVDGDVDHVSAALDNLFRWVNVEVETMEPATEIADRHRMSNNEACAVFPPKIPLFECRSSGRSGSIVSRSDGGDNSPHKLERELRRLRRQEDAVDSV